MPRTQRLVRELQSLAVTESGAALRLPELQFDAAWGTPGHAGVASDYSAVILGGDDTSRYAAAGCACVGCRLSYKVELKIDLFQQFAPDGNGSGWPGAQGNLGEIPGTTASTIVLTVGTPLQSSIETSGDLDFFRINLVAGQTYVFNLEGIGTGGLDDAYLEVRNAAGTLIAENDDAGIALNSFLRFTATETGTHFLVARGFDGTSLGDYRLSANVLTIGNSSPTNIENESGKPFFSWDEAAIQITRDGFSWGTSFAQPVTITYAFRANAPTTMPDDTGGFSRFNAAQIAATEAALAAWAAVANITFVRVGTGPGDAAFSDDATILFGNYSTGAASAAAFAYLPSNGNRASDSVQGDIWVNVSIGYNANPVVGEYGPQVLLHEIGHALGLRHPGPYNASENNPLNYGTNAPYFNDTRMWTTMSYFGSVNNGGSLPGFASLPQLHDIAAIQRLYGANTNTRSGDTIYGFNSNTGINEYSIANGLEGAVFAIWDGGGNDTLDLSGYLTSMVIDLREEGFSSAGPSAGVDTGTYNISIARGTVIENAIGGGSSDQIFGNNVNNFIRPGLGNDQINAGAGRDTVAINSTFSAATIARTTTGAWTVSTGAEGVDTLRQVEFVQFTDRTMFLDRAFRTFSADGTSNVLFRRSDGIVATWEVNGLNITNAVFLPSAGSEWTIRGTGDFDADGDDDVIWQRNDGLVYTWSMQAGTFQTANAITGVGGEWTLLGVGDFNGDNRDDIAWRRSDGTVFTWHMDGAAIASAQAITGLGSEWSFVATGDFNSDGRDDFVWRRADTGQTVLWQMNGGTIQSAAQTSQAIGPEWAIAGVGDFNRDGQDDFLLRRSSDGMVAIARMNGSTVVSITDIAAVSLGEWAVQQVGDYNGDGRDDILWRNTSSNVVFVWLMGDSSIQSAGGLSGIGTEWRII